MRPGRRPGADPRPAARDRRGTAAGRVELAIETKHPTRYAGLVERRWSSAATGSAGPADAAHGAAVRVMSFSSALDAADAGARPARLDRAPDGPGAAAVPGRQPADRRRRSPGRASRSSGPTRATSRERTRRAIRSTCGRSTSRPTSRSASSSASTRSSRTDPTRSCALGRVAQPTARHDRHRRLAPRGEEQPRRTPLGRRPRPARSPSSGCASPVPAGAAAATRRAMAGPRPLGARRSCAARSPGCPGSADWIALRGDRAGGHRTAHPGTGAPLRPRRHSRDGAADGVAGPGPQRRCGLRRAADPDRLRRCEPGRRLLPCWPRCGPRPAPR